MLLNGWQKISAGVVSGIYTWNVYKSPSAGNSIGKDFHVCLGFRTATPATLAFCVFRAWDSVNNLATGFPPWRCDVGNSGGGPGTVDYNWQMTSDYEINAPAQPLPSRTGDAVALTGLLRPSAYVANGNTYNGTGTNGTIPPSWGTTTLPGIDGGASNMTVGGVASIRGVTITNGGTGYTGGATVTFSGGGASVQATGTVTVNGSGVVTGITITNPLQHGGYTSQPTITITGNSGGSGATAEVRNGQWGTNLTVTNAGYMTVNGLYLSAGSIPALTSGSSASSGTLGAAPQMVNLGWNYKEVTLGVNGTDYVYSVTADRLIFALRNDGTSYVGAFYVGAYDSWMSTTDDPSPVCWLILHTSTGGPLTYGRPNGGLGGAYTEPKKATLETPTAPTNAMSFHFCTNLAWSSVAGTNGGGLPVSAPTVVEGYSNRFLPVRATLMGYGSPAGTTAGTLFIRGFLKDVYYCRGAASAWQDEIQWQVGGTSYSAVNILTGVGATYMLKV